MADGEVYRKSMTYTSRLVAITTGAVCSVRARGRAGFGANQGELQAGLRREKGRRRSGRAERGELRQSLPRAAEKRQCGGGAASGGGATAQADPGDFEADLAKKLANPVADLISVPFQNNLDYGGGPQRAGSQYILKRIVRL